MWIQEFQKHIESNFNEKWLSIFAHCGDNWYFLNSVNGLENWVNTMMVYLFLEDSLKYQDSLEYKTLEPTTLQQDNPFQVCSTFVPDSENKVFIKRILLFKLILNNYSFQFKDYSFKLLEKSLGFKVFNFSKNYINTQGLTIRDLLEAPEPDKNYYSLKEKEDLFGKSGGNHIDVKLSDLLVDLKREINIKSSIKKKKEGLLQLIKGYFTESLESYFGGLSENPNLFSINFLGTS